VQQKTFLFNVLLKRYLAFRARDPGSNPGRGTLTTFADNFGQFSR